MAKYLGLLIMAIASIGALFFSRYHGQLLNHPFLWYLAFIFLGLTGFLIAYLANPKENTASNDTLRQLIEKAKTTSSKIELEIDKCEFKDGSYASEGEDPDLSILRVLLPSSVSANTMEHMGKVTQSYMIYNGTTPGESRRYISNSFPFDQTTLQYYIMTNKLTLYVDRFDAKKYFFELKT